MCVFVVWWKLNVFSAELNALDSLPRGVNRPYTVMIPHVRTPLSEIPVCAQVTISSCYFTLGWAGRAEQRWVNHITRVMTPRF